MSFCQPRRPILRRRHAGSSVCVRYEDVERRVRGLRSSSSLLGLGGPDSLLSSRLWLAQIELLGTWVLFLLRLMRVPPTRREITTKGSMKAPAPMVKYVLYSVIERYYRILLDTNNDRE